MDGIGGQQGQCRGSKGGGWASHLTSGIGLADGCIYLSLSSFSPKTTTEGKGPPELVTGSRDGEPHTTKIPINLSWGVGTHARTHREIRHHPNYRTIYAAPFPSRHLAGHSTPAYCILQAACACGTCVCDTPCCRWSRGRGSPPGTAGPSASVRGGGRYGGGRGPWEGGREGGTNGSLSNDACMHPCMCVRIHQILPTHPGNSFSNADRCFCAGYDNGDLKVSRSLSHSLTHSVS